MDLKIIEKIINSQLEDGSKERDILITIAADPKAIPILLQLLNYEREENKKLINESNLELSRALVTIVEPDIKKTTGTFVVGQIKAHFHKWKHRVSCCFKFDDLP